VGEGVSVFEGGERVRARARQAAAKQSPKPAENTSCCGSTTIAWMRSRSRATPQGRRGIARRLMRDAHAPCRFELPRPLAASPTRSRVPPSNTNSNTDTPTLTPTRFGDVTNPKL